MSSATRPASFDNSFSSTWSVLWLMLTSRTSPVISMLWWQIEDLPGEWGRINETDGPFWPFLIRFAFISVGSTDVFLRQLNPWLSFWSCIILYHLGTCCPRWHSRISNPRTPTNYQHRQSPNGVSANNTPTVIHHASLINMVHIYHNLPYL